MADEQGSNSQNLLNLTTHPIPPNFTSLVNALQESNNRAQELLDLCNRYSNAPANPQGTQQGNPPNSQPLISQSLFSPAPRPEPVNTNYVTTFLGANSNRNPFTDDTNARNLPPQNQEPDLYNECKNSIFKLERSLTIYKNIEYDNMFLNACLQFQIVPQGLRCYKFPNRTTRDSALFKDLSKLYNDTGLQAIQIIINNNLSKLDSLKTEITDLQNNIFNHADFQRCKILFESISPKINRHVATIIQRKQRKLNRDLVQYQNNTAYLLPANRPNSRRTEQTQYHRAHWQYRGANTNAQYDNFVPAHRPMDSNVATMSNPPQLINNQPLPANEAPIPDFHPNQQPFLGHNQLNLHQNPYTPRGRGSGRGRGQGRGQGRGRGQLRGRMQVPMRTMHTRNFRPT